MGVSYGRNVGGWATREVAVDLARGRAAATARVGRGRSTGEISPGDREAAGEGREGEID